MVLLHLRAFARVSPSIKFLLKRFVGSESIIGQGIPFARLRALCGSSFFYHEGSTTENLGPLDCARVFFFVTPGPQPAPDEPELPGLYCPTCSEVVTDPLTCGDCAAVICRRCGTPLESPDELGIG